VQRFTGIATTTSRGGGLGDTNFDNAFTTADINNGTTGFEHVLYTQNTEFNPAADLNGDGKVTNIDLYALPAFYQVMGATLAVQNEARAAVLRRGDLTTNFTAP